MIYSSNNEFNISIAFGIMLWNQQRRITIAKETEVMAERIVINLTPIAL